MLRFTRSTIAALAIAAGLSACSESGGSRPNGDAPSITSFTADPATVQPGGTAQLTAVFSGGTGSIDQGIGAVTSGTPVSTSALSANTTFFTLTVTGPGGTATSTITVFAVAAPSIAEFKATPESRKITRGGSVSLYSAFAGGTGAIYQLFHGVPTEVAKNVDSSSATIVTLSVAGTYTYTLMVTNLAEDSASRQVEVTVYDSPEIQRFEATNKYQSIYVGAELSMQFYGGTGVVSPGNIPVSSGAVLDLPFESRLLSKYTLTVTNEAGSSVTRTAWVRWLPPLAGGADHSLLLRRHPDTAPEPNEAQVLRAGWDHGHESANNTTVNKQFTAVVGEDGGFLDKMKGVVSGAAALHSYVLPASSEQNYILAWGDNGTGQLGRPRCSGKPLCEAEDPVALPRSATPQAVARSVALVPLRNVVSVAAGQAHGLAVDADGYVWSWGANGDGQLGDGTTQEHDIATRISGISGVVAVAAGGKLSCALTSDGRVFQWGTWVNGTWLQPARISDLSGVVAIAAGDDFCLALKENGQVSAWGKNDQGQLGNGSYVDRWTPGAVLVGAEALSGVLAIAAGSRHSMALVQEGGQTVVYSWGDNRSRQLGLTPPYAYGSSIPLKNEHTNLAGMTIAAIAAGSEHSLALGVDGTLVGWGSNQRYQLGLVYDPHHPRIDEPTVITLP